MTKLVLEIQNPADLQLLLPLLRRLEIPYTIVDENIKLGENDEERHAK